MKTLPAVLLALAIASFTSEAFSADEYDRFVPKIKEKAEEISKQKDAKEIGVIGGEKYIATIIDDNNSFLVSRITANGDYLPIARASLGDIPYPSAIIKGGSVIVHAGYAHHGVYNTDYVFKSKGGKLYLSEIRDFANFGEDYHDPSIQIITLKIANFDEGKVEYWEKRFVIYKNGKEFKPGSGAWKKAMDNIEKRFSLPSPPSKSATLPKRRYALDKFEFEAVSRSIDRVLNQKNKN